MRYCLPLIPLGAALLSLPSSVAGQNPVTVNQSQGQIDFRIGQGLVASYHTGANVAKPYLWPMRAPNGVDLTRAWPIVKDAPGDTKDHVHQKSAWFCHGDVIPEGMSLAQKVRGVEGVDFWAESSGHGVIACTGVDKSGDNRIVTRNEWRTADGKKVLDEVRTIALHDLGGGRLFTVRCELTASAVPVTFGDTKEGSFGVRVNDQLRVGDRNKRNPKSVIRNAEGKTTEKACWGQVSAWCDYSGEVDGKPAGIAVFAHPDNPVPSCWHVRDYGLLAANPFGREKSGFPAMKGRHDLVKIDKGDRLTLRYAIYLHAGDADTGKVAEAFAKYTKLPD
jgi:hypothetical protein